MSVVSLDDVSSIVVADDIKPIAVETPIVAKEETPLAVDKDETPTVADVETQAPVKEEITYTPITASPKKLSPFQIQQEKQNLLKQQIALEKKERLLQEKEQALQKKEKALQEKEKKAAQEVKQEKTTKAKPQPKNNGKDGKKDQNHTPKKEGNHQKEGNKSPSVPGVYSFKHAVLFKREQSSITLESIYDQVKHISENVNALDLGEDYAVLSFPLDSDGTIDHSYQTNFKAQTVLKMKLKGLQSMLLQDQEDAFSYVVANRSCLT